MTTDTRKKGLETLIMRHMAGTDGFAVAPATRRRFCCCSATTKGCLANPGGELPAVGEARAAIARLETLG